MSGAAQSEEELAAARLETKFKELYVAPLLQDNGLEKMLVEKFSTQDDAENAVRSAGVDGNSTLLNDLLDKCFKNLVGYNRCRETLKDIVIQTAEKNLGDDAKPFADGADGDTLFRRLVICCYKSDGMLDCTKDPKNKGYYLKFKRVENVDDSCIKPIVTELIGKYPVPTIEGCKELADLYATQMDQPAAAAVGGGGGSGSGSGGSHIGGRRSRRRGHKGRKGRKSRRH